jgi:hypothetical protein
MTVAVLMLDTVALAAFAVPPVAAVYQFSVPAEAVAVSVVLPFWQMDTFGADVMVGSGTKVTGTAVRVVEDPLQLNAST